MAAIIVSSGRKLSSVHICLSIHENVAALPVLRIYYLAPLPLMKWAYIFSQARC